MNDPEKILIVDDEPNVRLVFRTTLEAAGYDIATAEDGAKALELLKQTSFHLILLDLRMPLQGGISVLQTLRERGNDTPVVIVTAHGSVKDAAEAMKLGAIDSLGKPLSPVSLRRVVAEVLERHGSMNSGGQSRRLTEQVKAGSVPEETFGNDARLDSTLVQ